MLGGKGRAKVVTWPITKGTRRCRIKPFPIGVLDQHSSYSIIMPSQSHRREGAQGIHDHPYIGRPSKGKVISTMEVFLLMAVLMAFIVIAVNRISLQLLITSWSPLDRYFDNHNDERNLLFCKSKANKNYTNQIYH